MATSVKPRQKVHRFSAFCAAAAVVAALLTGCKRDVSGTYLAHDTTGVGWLQLVRTPDNRVSGQLNVSMLQPDGTVDQNSIALTGAVDGENVTLNGSRWLGLQTITLSGTLRWNTLTLTGAQPGAMVFRRSTMPEYQSAIAELNARSSHIIAAKLDAQTRHRWEEAQQKLVSDIDQLVGRMGRFDSEADVHLSRFPGAEQKYESITAAVTKYVEHERESAGTPSAGLTRIQLSLAASRASLATEQLHNEAQTLESSLQGNIAPLVTESSNLERNCQQSVPNNLLTADEIGNRSAACSRLNDAVGPFKEKFDAVSSGLTRLEQVYQQQSAKQQQLLQEAQNLQ